MTIQQVSTELPDLDGQRKVDVVLHLLSLNREEIRHWQNYAFQASFWVNAGIVGVTTFIYEKVGISWPALCIASGGIFLLSLAYIVLMLYSQKAILANGNDLLKLQNILKLHTVGEYLPNESIYGSSGKWLRQRHLSRLIFINIAIALLCIGFLLACPPNGKQGVTGQPQQTLPASSK